MIVAGSPAAASEAAGSPRLMGIVIAGQDKIALFAGNPTITVREGDAVGNERVRAIGAQGVELVGPSGPRLVQPSGDASGRDERRTLLPPIVDPYRREQETENDQ